MLYKILCSIISEERVEEEDGKGPLFMFQAGVCVLLHGKSVNLSKQEPPFQRRALRGESCLPNMMRNETDRSFDVKDGRDLSNLS